jgi:hypothetical protein
VRHGSRVSSKAEKRESNQSNDNVSEIDTNAFEFKVTQLEPVPYLGVLAFKKSFLCIHPLFHSYVKCNEENDLSSYLQNLKSFSMPCCLYDLYSRVCS